MESSQIHQQLKELKSGEKANTEQLKSLQEKMRNAVKKEIAESLQGKTLTIDDKWAHGDFPAIFTQIWLVAFELPWKKVTIDAQPLAIAKPNPIVRNMILKWVPAWIEFNLNFHWWYSRTYLINWDNLLIFLDRIQLSMIADRSQKEKKSFNATLSEIHKNQKSLLERLK